MCQLRLFIGVLVEANGDVTVHVASVADWSTGSYVALPLVELGTHYYVMALESANRTRGLWQVVVTAVNDNTAVKLSLEERSARLKPIDVSVYLTHVQLQSSADVVLHNYQTLQVITV